MRLRRAACSLVIALAGLGAVGTGSCMSDVTSFEPGQCEPGATRCDGDRPERCDANYQWQLDLTCPFCRNDACEPVPSCAGLEPTCGPNGDESCCLSWIVPTAGGAEGAGGVGAGGAGAAEGGAASTGGAGGGEEPGTGGGMSARSDAEADAEGASGEAGTGGGMSARSDAEADAEGAGGETGTGGSDGGAGTGGVAGAGGGDDATADGFRLDRFEVTVGRFRRFVEAYERYVPKVGAGANPSLPDSGWQEEWTMNLPPDAEALRAELASCGGACSVEDREVFPTWTDEPGENESKPINCLTWYVAFAFCAWDGGWLPSDEDWRRAAEGGDERTYAWGDGEPDGAHAVYDCRADGSRAGACAASDIANAGSPPLGDGAWGHADLTGSLWEWIFDRASSDEEGERRGRRGAGFRSDVEDLPLRSTYGAHFSPTCSSDEIGLRCARRP